MSLGNLNVELSANVAKFVDSLGQAATASKRTSGEISTNFTAMRRSAAELNASLATENLNTTQIISGRRNIISLAEKELALTRSDGLEKARNLGYLKSATSEIERQKNALAGSGAFTNVTAQIVNAIKLRASTVNVPGLGGLGGMLAMRAYEPIGKFVEQGAGKLEEAFGGAIVPIAGMTAAMAALGVVALGVTDHMMNLAQSIENTAAATGLTTTQVQEYNELAKEMGISSQSVEMAFARIEGQLGKFVILGKEAGTGTQRLIQTLNTMHVAIMANGDLRQTNDILGDFYEQLRKIPDAGTRAAIEMTAFGTRGLVLAQIMEQDIREGKSFSEALDDIAKDGPMISDADLNSLMEARRNWEELKRDIDGATQKLEGFVALAVLHPMTGAKDLAETSLATMFPGLALAEHEAKKHLPAWAQTSLGMTSPAAGGKSSTQGAAAAASTAAIISIATENEALQKRLSILRAGGALQLQLQQAEAGYATALKMHNAALSGEYKTEISQLKEILALEVAHKMKGATVMDADAVAALTEKLRTQASAELALATAANHGAAALLLQKAAGEAEEKTASTRARLLEKERVLREQLANAEANPSPAGVAENAKIRAQIGGVKRQLAELNADVPQIRARYAEIAIAKSASQTGEAFTKENLSIGRELAAIKNLAAAYQQGGAAIAAAQIAQQLSADKQKVADLEEEFKKFGAMAGLSAADYTTGLILLGGAIDNADADLKAHGALLEQIASAHIAEEISKQTRAFADQATAIAALNRAQLESASAVRAAEVGMKVAAFKNANPGASDAQVASFRKLAQEQSSIAYQSALDQAAAQYEVGRSYDDTIAKLTAIKSLLAASGKSTIMVDFDIKQTGVEQAIAAGKTVFDAQNEQLITASKIDDAQKQQMRQWDEMANKVGTFSQRIRALADQIKESGDNFGEKVFGSLSKSLDDISSAMARLVVTGKNSFRELFQSLAEQMLKLSFQSTFSHIAATIQKHAQANANRPMSEQVPNGAARGISGTIGSIEKVFGIKTPGAKRDGSSSGSAIYVIPVSGGVGLPGAVPGTNPITGGAASIIGNLFPGGGTSGAPSGGSGGILSSIMGMFSGGGASAGASGAAGGGGIFSSILGMLPMFAGFMAAGGEVTPGKAYIVGENHPEVFVPRAAGRIIPKLQMGNAHHTTVNFHVHGVADADSFQRSSTQIYANLHAQLAMAHARNG